jgi:hypothetical protein
MKNVLLLLATVVAAATTLVGTAIAYILFLVLLKVNVPWWGDFLIAMGFIVVWYWGGFFLSQFLASLSLRFGHGE